jgi:hypothetical protein
MPGLDIRGSERVLCNRSVGQAQCRSWINRVTLIPRCSLGRPRLADIRGVIRHVAKVPDSTAANNNHEATNDGPPAQPTAAFRIITSARRPRSRPRGSWRICRQALPQAASV